MTLRDFISTDNKWRLGGLEKQEVFLITNFHAATMRCPNCRKGANHLEAYGLTLDSDIEEFRAQNKIDKQAHCPHCNVELYWGLGLFGEQWWELQSEYDAREAKP